MTNHCDAVIHFQYLYWDYAEDGARLAIGSKVRRTKLALEPGSVRAKVIAMNQWRCLQD